MLSRTALSMAIAQAMLRALSMATAQAMLGTLCSKRVWQVHQSCKRLAMPAVRTCPIRHPAPSASPLHRRGV
eukprot:7172763-Alexandrium_andersonii.AAC.1